MAILVDQARWAWRGTTWCHLVSDGDLDELHDFAGTLGCGRVAFQGDHYDIDVETRKIAIESGALECDSRELVRRLKAAGLRVRPSSYVKWELDYRVDRTVDDGDWELLQKRHPHVERVVEFEPLLDGFHREANGFIVLKRGTNEVVAFHGHGDIRALHENPSAGIFARADHRSGWSVESFSPAPSRDC